VPGAQELLRVCQSRSSGPQAQMKLPSVSVHSAAGGPLEQSARSSVHSSMLLHACPSPLQPLLHLQS
jgi:hypothetical protein